MRIEYEQARSRTTALRTVIHGTVVMFKESFHPAANIQDPYMVCTAPEGYRPSTDEWGQKIPIVNMRTGRISYVCGGREVITHESTCIVGPRSRC